MKSQSTRSLSAIMLGALTLTSTAALAAEPAPSTATSVGRDAAVSPTSRADKEEHTGLMLRTSLGVTALGGAYAVRDAEFGAGGFGPTLNVVVGGAVRPNLAIHLDLLAGGTHNAGVEADRPQDEFDAEGMSIGALGAGVTYYWMPYNVAFGGSLMFTATSLEADNGESLDTDSALMLKLDASKEWPISDSWDMGVGLSVFAGGGQGSDANGEDFDTGMSGLSVNLVASHF